MIGIDSVYCPLEERQRAWEEIGKTRPLKGLEEITGFYSLEEVPELAEALLDGKLRGRSLITIAGVGKVFGAVSPENGQGEWVLPARPISIGDRAVHFRGE